MSENQAEIGSRRGRLARAASGGSSLVVGFLVGMLVVAGCSEEASQEGGSAAVPTATAAAQAPPAAPESESMTQEELVAAGRSAYNANCIACHSMNPAQDGALGPAVAGASLALLEARVIRGEYPEGYEPKRGTRVMVPLPHLEPRLAELAAYLDSI